MFRRIMFCWIALVGIVSADRTVAAVMSTDARRQSYPRSASTKNVRAAQVQITDTSPRPDGVRLTTTWPTPTMKQGETIVNTLDVFNAIAGQKIRIQNSNHGASYFTTAFSEAMQAAIAVVPGVSYNAINAQQMEITLAPGSYKIAIKQTVTLDTIPGNVDDASWAPGTQLQTDWLLSSAPSNGAPVETGFTVDSKWITYAQQAVSPAAAPQVGSSDPNGSASSDARWSLLRSVPHIATNGNVTFEIGFSNYVLTSSTTLQLAVDNASTAGDADFKQGLKESIAAARNAHVSYDPQTNSLTFDPKTIFPFTFTMTAAAAGSNKDYILGIAKNQIGQIDVARAGVRLGSLSMPSIKPMLGVNEASGEFGVGNYNFKYAYPGKDRLGWAAAQGFGIIRVPFVFQNIQAASFAMIDEAAMRQLDPVLNDCAALRIICLLDMHNYGNYYRDTTAASQGLPGTIGVSNARLGNLWAQIATRYKTNTYVWFDLMNEPNKQTALEWVKTANTIAAAIRATGATNKIIFQGTAWDGAWTWETSGNATQLLKAYDPGNNFAFEAHQYLDRDGSGTSPNCVAGYGATRLEPFTTWLRTYGFQGIIGEVGWAANDGCTVEGAALLEHWRAATTPTAAGGYIGLTYWANGPWWPDSYMYLAEPRPFPAGGEPVQLKTLKRFIPPH